MNNDDINEMLKEKWTNLNLCNNELISQQINRFTYLTKSLEKQHMLKYQGKFYFVVGKYEQALEYLTKLLELEPNDLFSLKYRAEIYYILKKFEESLVDLDKLLEININDNKWIYEFYEEIVRK